LFAYAILFAAVTVVFNLDGGEGFCASVHYPQPRDDGDDARDVRDVRDS